LAKKIVVVTGAGLAIGRATAHRFAAEGAWVVLIDPNGASLDKVAKEIAKDRGSRWSTYG
jgi:NAD(P)-dependent dehydrogenase (short-subunit alcohol dehydrogenase family)